MLVRRTILGILAMTLLGCSGVSSLMVWNQSKQKVEVRVKAPEVTHGSKAQDKTVAIEPSSDASAIWWYVDAPEWIELQATFADGKEFRRKWTQAEYPPGMAKGASSGAYFTVELSEGEAKLRDPSDYDKFRRHPQLYVFLGSVRLCPAAILVAVAIFMAKSRKRNQAKLT